MRARVTRPLLLFTTMAFIVTPRLVVIVRTVLYAVIIICSFIVFCSLAVSKGKHDDNCILYAKKDHPYASRSTCDYSIAIAVLFCLLGPLAVIIITILTFLGILVDKLTAFTELPFLLMVIADGVALFLVFVSACINSVGLKTLCDSLVGNTNTPCSEAAVIPPHNPTELDFFYGNLSAAEGGAWTAFVMYLAQLIIGLMVLWKHERLPCLPCQPGSSFNAESPPQQAPPKF